ncbi:MAG: response regulator [Elusimicrobiota bacterium]
MTPLIMIVDDDADLRSALAVILRSRFRIVEAAGGAEALAALKRERPDLVLLDVAMPGLNGLEVLAEAKAAHPELLVVMLTSEQDIDTAARALRLGAVEYITKPFDAEYIRAEATRLIGPRAPPDERPWKVSP